MWARMTERTRQMILAAQNESRRLGTKFVGTEHLLLGMISVCELTDTVPAMAGQILAQIGIDLNALRSRVEQGVLSGPHLNHTADLKLTPRGKRVIDLAVEYARERGKDYVATEDLLVGLAREQGGLAARSLKGLGATPERLEAEVLAIASSS